MYMKLMQLCFVIIHCKTIYQVNAQEQSDDSREHNNKRIAIIGAGIGGSFVANYLSHYDKECNIDSVTLFDPYSPKKKKENTNDIKNWQGSRVESFTLSDGRVIEVGASIAYTGNKLLKEVADLDPDLKIVPPFFTSLNELDEEGIPKGFGIWNGTSTLNFLFNGAANDSWLSQIKLLYRYNIDLFRLQSAVNKALKSFNRIYDHLESSHLKSFFDTAHDMWDRIGLGSLAQISFNEFLDQINISSDLSWWRKLLPYQGNLRNELLEAVNLCNYNQNNDNLNGLVGLISFVPTQGELFSIEGGNNQLISSAWKQAIKTSNQFCSNRSSIFQHVKRRVTTVISDTNTFELWSKEELLGHFDIIILAAPLQQSRISFFIQSHHDGVVLQEMPLNGMIDSDVNDANEHFHVPPPLPISATTKYTQVITTVVSNATINYSYFHTDKDIFPRSVYLTSHAKYTEKFQSMTQITADGVFKLFSSEKFDVQTLDKLFQDGYKVEYVKVWGGPYGGATPNFGGGGEASKSLPYLLYDGGISQKGRSEGPALFYINSIEATTSTMEISAIGAKSVAKLVARRLGLLQVSDTLLSTEL